MPSKLDVVAQIKIDLKIVDFGINEGTDGKLFLFVVPMSQLCCRSGHNLMIYTLLDKSKTFECIKDIAMPWIVTSILPSPESLTELFCVPHRSRQLYTLNTQTGKVDFDFDFFFFHLNEKFSQF